MIIMLQIINNNQGNMELELANARLSLIESYINNWRKYRKPLDEENLLDSALTELERCELTIKDIEKALTFERDICKKENKEVDLELD